MVKLFLSVLKKLGVGRQVLCEPYVTSYDGVMADGYAAKYRCVGVDDHVVLDDRMARYVYGIAVLIKLEALGAKRNSLIELHMIAYDCSLSDNHTCAVVDAEILADTGTRMDVYAGKRVSKFCDYAGQDGYSQLKQAVCHTVVLHGHQ